MTADRPESITDGGRFGGDVLFRPSLLSKPGDAKVAGIVNGVALYGEQASAIKV